MPDFHFVLYERLPVWQEIFDFDSKGGCSLISGLFVQTPSLLTLMEFAEKALVSVTTFKGPDKIQVYFLAVRPVPPSISYLPAQPISYSIPLL